MKYELTARRYFELLNMSNQALQSSFLPDILMNDKLAMQNVKIRELLPDMLNQENCYRTSLSNTIAALEAFINHLGYIFCDDWINDKKQRFWDQYRKLSLFFKEKEILFSSKEMYKEPYFGVENDRLIRNDINHIHASKNDYFYEDSELMADMENGPIELQILFSHWVSITYEYAQLAYNNVKSFIENIHNLINQPSVLSKLKVLTDNGRKKLLDQFLKDPFMITMVVGTTAALVDI